ncbi:MAG TPA: metallophosphoesterase [Kofleriaceae bacterium]|nr:metallophosphoesterase [Kofleriaceae bacterium]
MLFRLAMSVVSGLVHYYVYRRVVGVLEPSRRMRWSLAAIVVLLFVSVPLQTSARMWAPGFSSVMGWVSGPWLAFVGVAATYFAILDVLRGGVWLARKALRRPAPTGAALSRRDFLTRVGGGAAIAVTGASVGIGMIEARGEHEIVTIEVPLAKLPKALDGFSIVQLSDLHTGMTIDRAFVQRVVERANALQPDVIALTGDLVDGTVENLRDDIAPLAGLRAPHGVFAVTGNHEYYAGVDAWIAELTRLGARYLRNQRVTIGSGDATFDLAGVDDYSAHDWPGHGEDLGAATSGRDANRALVLLAHQPRQVKNAANHGVDLQLSGHTHGGQIWPWHYFVKLQQGGLLAGKYEHRGTQLYVTRGCGYWGPPVRLLAPLEITRVILRSAA